MTARTHSYRHVRYPDTALAGKVVVITGGGTGMGRSLALEAARRGGNVVITGRRPAPLLETKADMDDLLRHLGLTNQTLVVQGDVSDPKYVGEMFEQIEKEFGRIDVLYNNAGVSGPVVFGSAYEEGHFDEYREAVNVHLTGSWMASLEAARIMEGQPGGGTIVMVGTFYSESIHHHVLHAYPGRLPYTSAQSAKLALGDYLAWALAGKAITVLSLNPSAVSTERIQRGSGVFDKGSKARARIGRNVSPEALERDTLDRTVGHAFVDPRDFAALALEVVEGPFRRTIGGVRLPMGGVTYEQPPGVLPSPAALARYPDLVGKVALVVVGDALSGDVPLIESSAAALARAGAAVVLSGGRPEILEPAALKINARGGEGTATVSPVNLSHAAQVQELFDSLPRIDLLLYFTGSVDWKRPLTNLPHDEWTARVDRFGLIPRFLCWQAERRMDRDGIGRHDRPGGAGSLGRPDDPGAEPRAGLPGDAAPRGGDRGHGTRADAKGELRGDRPRPGGEREHRARPPRPHRRQEPAGPARKRPPPPCSGSSTTASASRGRFSCPTSRTRSPPSPRPRGNPGHGIGEGGRRHRGDPQPREGDLPPAGGGEGDGRHRKPVPADGFAGSGGSRKGPRRARRGRRRPDADAPLRRARPVGAHGRRAAREACARCYRRRGTGSAASTCW